MIIFFGSPLAAKVRFCTPILGRKEVGPLMNPGCSVFRGRRFEIGWERGGEGNVNFRGEEEKVIEVDFHGVCLGTEKIRIVEI